MPEYRIYMLTDGNKIAGPPEEVMCDDDQQAIQRAKQWLDGYDVEVSQGARVVTAKADNLVTPVCRSVSF
jgi:hypothetical protein